MKRTLPVVFIVLGACGLAFAEDIAPGAAAQKQPLTVAILDFAAKDPGSPDLGRELADAIGALITDDPGFVLVDRSIQERALQELSLNLSGLVDPEQAVKVGKLVGARIIVTGRVFTLGQQTFIVAKLIGTETSLVESVTAKGAADADLGELTVALSKDLSKRLRDNGPKLIASAEPAADPLTALKQELAKRRRPVVAIIVREEHRGAPAATRTPDPAVETEIKRLLIECGFTVKDVPQNDLTGFARDWKADNVNSWPRWLAGVDLLIAGEGFSEFAARIGNLFSASARAELNAVDRHTGRIVHAARITTRGADLSENIAAKNALEKAGHLLAIELLQQFAMTLPTRETP